MTGITTVLVVVMSQASHSAVALKGYETRAECEADKPAVQALYLDQWSDQSRVECVSLMRPKPRPVTADKVLRDLREWMWDGDTI